MQLKKCLGVDIGATSVKVAEVVAEKGGVRVAKLARAEYGLPPGPMDNERINIVSKAIRDLLKEQRIATKHAVFCLPGQTVFIRRIRVPRTTEERLHRIVAYEAKQQIPYALENSLMEYQVFDWGDDQDVEVLLVAIKKDIVSDFMKVISRTGLKAIRISVSSLAMFNFHVFDSTQFSDIMDQLVPGRGEAAVAKARALKGKGKDKGGKFSLGGLGFGKKKAAAAMAGILENESGEPIEGEEMDEDIYEEVHAYVNVGAQTFDLAIGRLGKHKIAGFNRSVPWAGNELSRSLQERLGLASLDDAENVKRNRSIIIVPGREDEAMEGGIDTDASEFTTAWADRLILDLRKSFDFYIAQPDGMAVDTIVLSGGQALQRNLASYIEDKLGIPVEVKSRTENSALKLPDTTSEEEFPYYLIAVGLGITGVGYGQVLVDFLPPDLKALRDLKQKNIEVGLLVAAIVLMIGISSQVGTRNIASMNGWLERNKNTIETNLTTKVKLQKARDEMAAVNNKVTDLGRAMGERAFWLEFLGVIESLKPADVLITQVSMAPTGMVTLACETEVVNSISEFAKRLNDMEQRAWIERAELSSPRPSFSNFMSRQVYKFDLRLKAAWKKTRLASARVTLAPGIMQQTPAPVQATQSAVFGGLQPGEMASNK